MTETILANATLVLPDGVMPGHLVLRDGLIAEIGEGCTVPKGALDCEGDLLAPGLIELHTDNLERHIEPRPKVAWPHAEAIIAHECAGLAYPAAVIDRALTLAGVPPAQRPPKPTFLDEPAPESKPQQPQTFGRSRTTQAESDEIPF